MSSSLEHLVIIGSGPAGWSAATYAARAQLKPLVFEGAITEENRMAGTLPLGQLALTSEVEKRAISIGVCYLYLSVNNSNKKARSLYASQGWTQASSRSLLFKVLIS